MKKTNFSKILSYLPAFFWMIFIFYLSSRQTVGIGTTRTNRFLILKSFHLIEYALLFLFLYFPIRQLKKTIMFTYIYALSDELHQSFVPGRQGKFQDTLIDIVGIFLGLLILKLILRYFSISKNKLL